VEVEVLKITDNVCEPDPDLDLVELLYEIEEFGMRIPDEGMKRMDGTFDAIVCYVASVRPTTS
jgi:hypothetical protein